MQSSNRHSADGLRGRSSSSLRWFLSAKSCVNLRREGNPLRLGRRRLWCEATHPPLRSSRMSNQTSIVTTSWDDGDPLDLRLAEMLSLRGLPATFYVPLSYRDRPRLSDSDMRELADQNFEIGAHGVRHLDLRMLEDRELA